MIGHPRRRWRELRAALVRRRLAGPRLVAAFADACPDAFFIEIGSNDGQQHDPLREMVRSRPWRGIMVEPVPYVFRRLEGIQGENVRVTLVNAAIADRDATLPFFHVREADRAERASLPGWYDAIGSFSRDAVAGHVDHIPDIERRIVEIEVPTLTFESLCAAHRVDRLDLLLIDTEGYDAEILKQVDLTRWRPRLLVYEHYHLAREDRDGCRARIERAGYETLAEGFDTWCVRTDVDDALTRAIRRRRAGIPELTADAAG